jgi:hypothetical protein
MSRVLTHVVVETSVSASKTLRSESSGARFRRPELDALLFFAFFLVFLSHTIPIKGDSPRWLFALRVGGSFGFQSFSV